MQIHDIINISKETSPIQWRLALEKDAYNMKAKAAAAPARPRPALRPDAAPVDSGRPADLVDDAPLGRREPGTVMLLVGMMMVELPAGMPVLIAAGAEEGLVTMVVALALLETAGAAEEATG
jgi:hypothetical protein